MIKMGGTKKKYPKRQKYITEEKKFGKYVEEKKELPKEEDLKSILEIWQSKSKKAKKQEENSEEKN